MSETVKGIVVAVLEGAAVGFVVGTAIAYVCLCRQDGESIYQWK